jgi:hypothetical protein
MSTVEFYIARRPFKTVGKFFEVGSIIEDPTEIRLFKTKVSDKKIVRVTEDNLLSIAEYIASRTGVSPLEKYQKYVEGLKGIKPDEVKPDEVKPDEVKPDEVKSDEVKPDEVKPDEVKPEPVKQAVGPAKVVTPAKVAKVAKVITKG